MLKNPLFLAVAVAAGGALFLLREQIQGLIEDLVGTEKELTKLEMTQEHYADGVLRSARVLDAEKAARKKKIETIKEEAAISDFMKKNEKALTDIQRLEKTI